MNSIPIINYIEEVKKGFDLLADHVVITDARGKILYLNPAAEKKTGFSATEALGKKPGELWGGGMPADFYKKMFHTISVDKQPFVGEVQNKRKDGKIYWQELHISPVLDETGGAKYFIAIEPDITEKIEKQKFRDSFLSQMAHQLKTPLTATKWGIELLLERSDLGPAQREMLKKIESGNVRLIEMVTKLVQVARNQT